MEPQQHTTPSTPPTLPSGDSNTLMGVLSYLGPLVIVSYLVAKDNPFVRFHIKQGLVLLTIEVAIWILRMSVGPMFWNFWWIFNLLNLATLVLSVIGIIAVIQKKETSLPFVGSYSRYFNI